MARAVVEQAKQGLRSLPGALGAPAVVVMHRAAQQSSSRHVFENQCESFRRSPCMELSATDGLPRREHELRALTSRAGHERACMRIVEWQLFASGERTVRVNTWDA